MQQPADLDDVRASWDAVADTYVEVAVARFAAQPWLRAALDAFAEGVAGLGPVLDVGCGPGHVTAHLAARGLDARGVDLSPRMVEIARARYPALRFDVGSATALDLAPGSLGGFVGWWSLFNLPRDAVAAVVADAARALVPGGQLLVGTHAGDGDEPRRAAVSCTTHLWSPDDLVALLSGAGLEPVADLRLPSAVDRPPKVVVVAGRPRQHR